MLLVSYVIFTIFYTVVVNANSKVYIGECSYNFCEQDCVQISFRHIKCKCRRGYILKPDGRSCDKEYDDVDVGDSSSGKSQYWVANCDNEDGSCEDVAVVGENDNDNGSGGSGDGNNNIVTEHSKENTSRSSLSKVIEGYIGVSTPILKKSPSTLIKLEPTAPRKYRAFTALHHNTSQVHSILLIKHKHNYPYQITKSVKISVKSSSIGSISTSNFESSVVINSTFKALEVQKNLTKHFDQKMKTSITKFTKSSYMSKDIVLPSYLPSHASGHLVLTTTILAQSILTTLNQSKQKKDGNYFFATSSTNVSFKKSNRKSPHLSTPTPLPSYSNYGSNMESDVESVQSHTLRALPTPYSNISINFTNQIVAIPHSKVVSLPIFLTKSASSTASDILRLSLCPSKQVQSVIRPSSEAISWDVPRITYSKTETLEIDLTTHDFKISVTIPKESVNGSKEYETKLVSHTEQSTKSLHIEVTPSITMATSGDIKFATKSISSVHKYLSQSESLSHSLIENRPKTFSNETMLHKKTGIVTSSHHRTMMSSISVNLVKNRNSAVTILKPSTFVYILLIFVQLIN